MRSYPWLFLRASVLAPLCVALSTPVANAAPVRLWTELAGVTMGGAPPSVAAVLKHAKLKKQALRGKKNKGKRALAEKVSFERHSPATVVYRFADDQLFEIELRYAKKGRTKRMAAFLQKKFGNCKKKGKAHLCKAGDRVVVFRSPGGKVQLTFTSPAVLAAFRKAHAPTKKIPEAEEEEEEEDEADDPGKGAQTTSAAQQAAEREKHILAKKAAEAAASARKTTGRLIRQRSDDPALWDALGVKMGPVTLFRTQLRRKGAAQFVAAGFRRAGPAALAAILTRDDDGYHLHHLGPGCPGRPEDARAIDFRLEGKADVALFARSGETRNVALIPFDQRFAGAKFVGGRFGGQNAYRCYELGEDIERIDFIDIDHDKSIDLLLTYRSPRAQEVHDVYFFQGNDFYFRETRPGAPRPAK